MASALGPRWPTPLQPALAQSFKVGSLQPSAPYRSKHPIVRIPMQSALIEFRAAFDANALPIVHSFACAFRKVMRATQRNSRDRNDISLSQPIAPEQKSGRIWHRRRRRGWRLGRK